MNFEETETVKQDTTAPTDKILRVFYRSKFRNNNK